MSRIMAMPNHAIGEGVVYVGSSAYTIRPTFAALASLNDDGGLQHTIDFVCHAYSVATQGGTPRISYIAACANMLAACSDIPITMLGWPRESGGALKWRQGELPIFDMIILAHHCIRWGVNGDPRERMTRAAKKQLENKPQPFDPAEFVAILMDEFHQPANEAWQMTMTEFQRLCEHRNKKAWGDRPPPVTDDERDSLVKQYRDALKRVAK